MPVWRCSDPRTCVWRAVRPARTRPSPARTTEPERRAPAPAASHGNAGGVADGSFAQRAANKTKSSPSSSFYAPRPLVFLPLSRLRLLPAPLLPDLVRSCLPQRCARSQRSLASREPAGVAERTCVVSRRCSSRSSSRFCSLKSANARSPRSDASLSHVRDAARPWSTHRYSCDKATLSATRAMFTCRGSMSVPCLGHPRAA